MSLTIGSLFSGIGGLELGLERAGLGPVVWQVEQSEYCRAVLAKHWPDATRYEDVRDVGGRNLAPVDVICGGFPCQDISDVGQKAGLRGEESGLWREYARIIRELAPRYVVVENVAALLSRGFGDVLGELADCGYDAEWSCVSACSVGAPHMRDRVFVVAYPACVPRLQAHSAPDADRSARHLGRERPSPRHSPAGRAWNSRPTTHRDVLESDVLRMADGVPFRVERSVAIGNAVVPQVAEIVGQVVLRLEAERLSEVA